MDKIENILYLYPDIPERVQKLNAELNMIMLSRNESYNTLKAVQITDMPHGTGTGDPTGDAVSRMIDKADASAQKIIEQINTLLDYKTELDYILNSGFLDYNERRYIELRYFDRYNKKRIPDIMYYSSRQCDRFRKKAIAKIEAEMSTRKAG